MPLTSLCYTSRRRQILPQEKLSETGARQPTEGSICHTQTAKRSHLLALPVIIIIIIIVIMFLKG